jgi:methyltransferase family protein
VKKILHVGCGSTTKANTTVGFNTEAWQEIRFDIDPACSPGVVGTIVDMKAVDDKSVDAIFSSHNIEHGYAHEIGRVLSKFLRVLADDGFVVLTCPDLQSACEAVVADKLLDPLYVSAAGPIAPLDVLYGFRPAIAAGNTYMAHKCGFTFSVLCKLFLSGGFKGAYGGRRPQAFDLWIVASKSPRTEAEMQALARDHLPP